MTKNKTQDRKDKLKEIYKKQAEVLDLSREILASGSLIEKDTLLCLTRATQKLAEIIGCTVYDIKAEHLAIEVLKWENLLEGSGL